MAMRSGSGEPVQFPAEDIVQLRTVVIKIQLKERREITERGSRIDLRVLRNGKAELFEQCGDGNFLKDRLAAAMRKSERKRIRRININGAVNIRFIYRTEEPLLICRALGVKIFLRVFRDRTRKISFVKLLRCAPGNAECDLDRPNRRGRIPGKRFTVRHGTPLLRLFKHEKRRRGAFGRSNDHVCRERADARERGEPGLRRLREEKLAGRIEERRKEVRKLAAGECQFDHERDLLADMADRMCNGMSVDRDAFHALVHKDRIHVSHVQTLPRLGPAARKDLRRRTGEPIFHFSNRDRLPCAVSAPLEIQRDRQSCRERITGKYDEPAAGIEKEEEEEEESPEPPRGRRRAPAVRRSAVIKPRIVPKESEDADDEEEEEGVMEEAVSAREEEEQSFIREEDRFFKKRKLPPPGAGDEEEEEAPERGSRKWVGWVAALVVVVIAVLAAVTVVFGSAKIEIVFKQTPWNYSGNFVADKAVSTINAATDVMPAQVFTLPKNVTQLFPATGKDNVSLKAQGTITIYNAYSSAPQPLVATTRFVTPDGKIFRLVSKVVVPGASIVNGKIVPSSTTATVAADQAGSDYNIGPTPKLTIPGFQGTAKYDAFSGALLSGTSGGFVGVKAVPTASDIASAKQKVTDILSSELQNGLSGGYTSNFKILSGATNMQIVKLTVNTSTDQNGQFSVYGEGVLTAIGFDENAFKAFLLSLAQSTEPSSTFSGLTLNYTNVVPDFANGKLSFSVAAQGSLEPALSTPDFLASISGKSITDAKSAIAALPQLQDGSISVWPAWLWQIPGNAKRIQLTVK